MPERRAVVASKVGLHARPAALFAKAAGRVSFETKGARQRKYVSVVTA